MRKKKKTVNVQEETPTVGRNGKMPAFLAVTARDNKSPLTKATSDRASLGKRRKRCLLGRSVHAPTEKAEACKS